MPNPVPAARQHLYDRLKANVTLMGASMLGNRFSARQPAGQLIYPFGYIERAASNLNRAVGIADIDDNSPWDVNLVGKRETTIDQMDDMVTEVINTLDMTLGGNAKGKVSSCSVEDIFDVPFEAADGLYPRTIIRVRLYSSAN
jgi:hypothetical protein